MKSAMILLALTGFVPSASFSQVYISPWESGAAQYRAYRISADVASCGGYCSPGPSGSSGYYPYGGGSRGQIIGAIATGAAGGAGIGYGIGGGRGAAIGAAIGGGVSGLTAYAINRAARGPQAIDCTKRKLGKKEAAACEAALVEQQQQAELSEREFRGGYLRNASSRWNLEIADCGERVAVLRPGERRQALGARCGYQGTFLIRSTSNAGMVDEQVAAFIISDDAGGWVFHLPPVRQRRGGN